MVNTFSNRVNADYRAQVLSHVWRDVINGDDPIALYSVLDAYVSGVGVYDTLREILTASSIWSENLRAIANPASAVVEFYVASVWGSEPLEVVPGDNANDGIVDAIAQVWDWSNWDTQSRLCIRDLATHGDMFVKVATKQDDAGKPTRVFFQLLDPATVGDFDVDERGYLTWLRFDLPTTRRREDGTVEEYTWTEVWDKAAQTYRGWEHTGTSGAGTGLESLGPPTEQLEFRQLGIDFIPVVQMKFRDMGDLRGAGCFTHALEVIDECCRMATELHSRLFRYGKADMVLSSAGRDPEGASIPPPYVAKNADNQVEIGDESLYSLPAGWDIRHLIAPIDYAGALAILQDQLITLERYTLPELRYYRVAEAGGDLSGRAIRFMLSAAIDRVREARANADAALVRLDQMALTIGAAAGLDRFTGLGSFENGDFDHHFADRDVIPLSALEEAQVEQAQAGAALTWTQAGMSLQEVLRRHGMADDEIDRVMAEAETGTNTLGSALLAGFNAGPAVPVTQPTVSGPANLNGNVPVPNGVTQ